MGTCPSIIMALHDEKRPSEVLPTTNHRLSPRGAMNHSRASRRGCARVIAACLITAFITFWTCYQWVAPRSFVPSSSTTEWAEPHIAQGATGDLVPLEAHIISKCPDTRDALRELLLPVMQRVSSKVDFKLSYIGKLAPHDGVECKHGPSECMGNIVELCALEHAIDFEKLNECATRDDGAHGLEMLRESVERTADAGVTKSCTIRLDNEIYCIRDGGEWTDCPHGAGVNDLILAVEKLYNHRQSS